MSARTTRAVPGNNDDGRWQMVLDDIWRGKCDRVFTHSMSVQKAEEELSFVIDFEARSTRLIAKILAAAILADLLTMRRSCLSSTCLVRKVFKLG
jgi:hypothetical protein